jgi:hypothetical protein
VFSSEILAPDAVGSCADSGSGDSGYGDSGSGDSGYGGYGSYGESGIAKPINCSPDLPEPKSEQEIEVPYAKGASTTLKLHELFQNIGDKICDFQYCVMMKAECSSKFSVQPNNVKFNQLEVEFKQDVTQGFEQSICI